jgi:hypothetical protein
MKIKRSPLFSPRGTDEGAVYDSLCGNKSGTYPRETRQAPVSDAGFNEGMYSQLKKAKGFLELGYKIQD